MFYRRRRRRRRQRPTTTTGRTKERDITLWWENICDELWKTRYPVMKTNLWIRSKPSLCLFVISRCHAQGRGQRRWRLWVRGWCTCTQPSCRGLQLKGMRVATMEYIAAGSNDNEENESRCNDRWDGEEGPTTTTCCYHSCWFRLCRRRRIQKVSSSSIWREEIGNRKIVSSIWREGIGNRNRLVNIGGKKLLGHCHCPCTCPCPWLWPVADHRETTSSKDTLILRVFQWPHTNLAREMEETRHRWMSYIILCQFALLAS